MKKFLLTVLKSIGVILGIIVFYVILVLLIPYIPVAKKPVAERPDIAVYILTNGMHTDVVMPVNSKIINWNDEIPAGKTRSGRTDYRYISIGWGDKGFYLDTPTWAELKPSTAVKAAFWLSESAMHCTYYDKMEESEDCKKIMLTEKQYAALAEFVKSKFDRDQNGKPIFVKTDAVYGKDDTFYDAQGSYSFLNTCNTWTNNALKAAGQKAALWTATDFGIFQHYP